MRTRFPDHLPGLVRRIEPPLPVPLVAPLGESVPVVPRHAQHVSGDQLDLPPRGRGAVVVRGPVLPAQAAAEVPKVVQRAVSGRGF